MTAVHATWLNAKTNPIFVTGNSSVYKAVYSYLGDYVYGGNYYDTSDKDNNTDLAYSLIASKYIASASYNNAGYGFSYMSYNANKKLTSSDNVLYYLYYCFLADNDDADSYILPAEALLGNKSNGVKGWFETFTESYGGTLINDKYSSVLFESVDEEFTDITITADDTFTLTDEIISQSLWQKFIGGGYNVSGSNEYTVSAIKKVESSDFKSTSAATCDGLYIDESDYDEFVEFYNSAVNNNETVYLFRYYQSDYTHYEVAEYIRDDSDDYTLVQGDLFGYDFVDTNAYFCQMCVQLDFDIIDLTFTKDNVNTVIPVVMSPIDIAADGDSTLLATSDSSYDWLKIIIMVLLLLLIFIIFAPFIPYIAKLIVWVILLPFKLLGAIYKAIRNLVKKNSS